LDHSQEAWRGICNKEIIPAVNQLFNDVAEYNRNFVACSILGINLLVSIESGDKADSKTQKIAASDLAGTHENVLDKIGLVLEEQVSGVTFVDSDEGSSDGQLRILRINVFDRDKFSSFLKTLEPKQVKETGLKSNLEILSRVLAQEILYNYSLKEPTEYALQLFDGLEGMIEQYKRLNMAGSVGKLETYSAHARRGDLREYVRIEKDGLLSEPGSFFGPADWQNDSTPEYLEERWGRALEIVDETKANPKAQELYQQLVSHLLKCVEIAIRDMESRAGPTREEEQMRGTLKYVYDTLNKNA
jgi:hypothetical protein